LPRRGSRVQIPFLLWIQEVRERFRCIRQSDARGERRFAKRALDLVALGLDLKTLLEERGNGNAEPRLEAKVKGVRG
jgi:hypothetical protein